METTKALREATVTRVFDAPRDLVYQAWIDPAHFSQWYGPKGFTVSKCELDATEGGVFDVTMVSPDGAEYPSQGYFGEIIENEKIVLTLGSDNDEDGNFQFVMLNTVTFEEEDGKTTMTFKIEVTKATPAHLENVSGLEYGWKAAFEKLEGYLVSVG